MMSRRLRTVAFTALALVAVVTPACGPDDDRSHLVREVEPPTAAEIEADGHVADARRLLLADDAPGAEASARQALALRPDDAAASDLLGRALVLQDRVDDARAAFRSALRVAPDAAAVRQRLARTYEAAGDDRGAAEVYREWTKADDESADAFLGLGRRLLALGEFEPARDAFKRAVRSRPSSSEARSELGLALKALGQLDAAEQRHVEAVERDAASRVAWERLGLVREALGPERRADALDAFDRALALGDERPQLVARAFRLARLLARDGRDPAAAVRAATRAAELLAALTSTLSTDQLPWFGLDERPPEVRDALRRENRLRERIAADPGGDDALAARRELSTLLHGQGLLDEAIAVYRHRIETGDDRARRDVGARLGGALLAAGRTAEAEPLLVGAGDDDRVALRHLAWLRLTAGRHAEALDAYDRALALDAGDGRARRGRGLALLALDRLDEGVEAFR